MHSQEKLRIVGLEIYSKYYRICNCVLYGALALNVKRDGFFVYSLCNSHRNGKRFSKTTGKLTLERTNAYNGKHKQ